MILTAERAEAILEMRTKGATFDEIERALHCSRTTVRKALPPELKHARFMNGELRPMPPIPRKPKPTLSRPVSAQPSAPLPVTSAPYRAEREHGRWMPDAIRWWDRCDHGTTRQKCPRCG